MKKFILGFSALLICHFVAGQALEKGTFSFNLGFDGGVHGTESRTYFNDDLVGTPDTSAAGTSLFRLNAQYHFLNRLSAGLDFRIGKYIEDPDNMEADGNSVSLYAISLRFYPVNRDKFNLYLGSTLGLSALEINRKTTTLIPLSQQYKYSSGHFGLESGFNWYFINRFGLNFCLGYLTQNYTMNEFRVNGNELDLSNQKYKLKTIGLNLGIGLSFYL